MERIKIDDLPKELTITEADIRNALGGIMIVNTANRGMTYGSILYRGVANGQILDRGVGTQS